jgi:hypothetical protein
MYDLHFLDEITCAFEHIFTVIDEVPRGPHRNQDGLPEIQIGDA